MTVLPTPPYDPLLPDAAVQAFEDHEVKEIRGNWIVCHCGTSMVESDRSAHLRGALREAGIALLTDRYVHHITSEIEDMLSELTLELDSEEFKKNGRDLLARSQTVHMIRHIFGVPCGPEEKLSGPLDGSDLVELLKDSLKEHEAESFTFSEGGTTPDITCSCGEVVPGESHGEHRVVELSEKGIIIVRHSVAAKVLDVLCSSVQVWEKMCNNALSDENSGVFFPEHYLDRLHKLAEYSEFLQGELSLPITN